VQADIRVTALPPGMDPDEVVNRDPQEWQRLVDQAKPVVMHVMETLAASRDISDPKVKSEIAAQVLPLIQDVPSAIERDTYRQSLARLLRVDERSLPAEGGLTRRPGQRSRPRSSTQPALVPLRSAASGSYAMEAFALGVLLRRPDLLYRVDRDLQKFGLQRISADDFQHADHQAILRLLLESIDQDVAEPLNHVLNRLSLPMMEVADDLLARTVKLDPNDERVLGDLLRALLDMRKSSLSQSLEFLRFAMEDSQQQGDLGIDQYQHSLAQNMLLLQRLDQARGFYTGRLLHSR
jgi:DNA primase